MKSLFDIIDESIVLFDEDLLYSDEMLLEAETKKVSKPKPSSKKNNHLDHVEDLIVRHGEVGMGKVSDTLGKVHSSLRGSKPSNFSLSTKFDGSPSIVFGHDKSGKWFVGTKAFFNKSPKINYKDSDIDDNHGDTPSLSKKLKNSLKHLKDICPKTGIFQGDLMYQGEDVSDSGEHLSFTPNTLTYNVKKGSAEGEKMMKSKLGIAIHTEYKPGLDGELHAEYNPDMSKFKESPNVHVFSTNIKGQVDYKPSHQKEFAGHLSKAQGVHDTLVRTKGYDKVKDHSPLLLAYINNSVRNNTSELSTAGYISFLHQQFSKRMDSVRLDKSKDNVKSGLDTEIKNVNDNKSTFENLFKLHGHVTNAKNTLLKSMSSKSPYGETILGNKSKPEGFVASHNGEASKLVDRQHFSKANMDWNSEVNPSDKPTILNWGKFDVAHKGHEKAINTGATIAGKTGADHKIVASRNGKLNPQDKLKWMKMLFPGKHLTIAGENAPTLVAQLQHLHHNGVKDLTIVTGADRVQHYTQLLAKHNGPGKSMNFKKIKIVSAGERDASKNDVSGMSSTKMKDHAKKGDFKSFRKGIPDHVKDKDAYKLYGSVRE